MLSPPRLGPDEVDDDVGELDPASLPGHEQSRLLPVGLAGATVDQDPPAVRAVLDDMLATLHGHGENAAAGAVDRLQSDDRADSSSGPEFGKLDRHCRLP